MAEHYEFCPKCKYRVKGEQWGDDDCLYYFFRCLVCKFTWTVLAKRKE